MYQNLPGELKSLPQWVVVDMSVNPSTGKPRKLPVNPKTLDLAIVTDRNTWGTFEEAHARVGGRYPLLGFVFSENDPYSFIDLDPPLTPEQADRHTKILAAFQSYAELSCSGGGVHIIVRGNIGEGKRRDRVEVYSRERYAIMTGAAIKHEPITDQQPLLSMLASELGKGGQSVLLTQRDSGVADEAIFTMAARAVNGDKFILLCDGRWEHDYPSQSEADFALLAMLGYYTSDNEQVRRMFRATALGQRAKALKNDKYLDRCLSKVRAKQPPIVDIDPAVFAKKETPHSSANEAGQGPHRNNENNLLLPGLVAEPHIPEQESERHSPAAQYSNHTPPARLMPPPGLLGEVTKYIFESAVRPVQEVAIAGAVAMMAGICGRGWNISRTGLNQYVILIAPTGAGKDGAAAGVDALFSEIRKLVPAITQFRGPAVFSSGQGLLRVLEESPCLVAVLGEFGYTLQTLSNPRANSAETALLRNLLDLYMKSGSGRILDPSAYSDKQKNTKIISSPALSILGESSPGIFFSNLSQEQIEVGLVPRFLMIEMKDDGPPRNRNAGFPPPPALVQALADVATTALMMQNNNAVQVVNVDPNGQALLDEFESLCDTRRRESWRGADKEVWTRAHLKAIRLAALAAVSCNWHQPVVDTYCAQWAIQLVLEGSTALVQRVDSGQLGQGDVQQDSDLRAAVERYAKLTKAQRLTNKCPSDCADHPSLIPFAYIRDQLRRRAAFRNARAGVKKAIEDAVQDGLRAGLLRRVPQSQLIQMGVTSEVYVRGEG